MARLRAETLAHPASSLMPRFSHDVLASLKRAMLPRVRSCFFAPEDVEKVVEETGLDRSSVTHWAEFLRWRVKNGLITDVEAFLRSSEEDQKVT